MCEPHHAAVTPHDAWGHRSVYHLLISLAHVHSFRLRVLGAS